MPTAPATDEAALSPYSIPTKSSTASGSDSSMTSITWLKAGTTVPHSRRCTGRSSPPPPPHRARLAGDRGPVGESGRVVAADAGVLKQSPALLAVHPRSEEHTSELQSPCNL